MKLSVCIPVYNVEKYIERCARSLFEQTVQNGIEFIFVDDCSSDASIDVVRRALEDYPARKLQVRILRNERNLGVAAVRNVLLDTAVGDYLLFVDPDDYFDETMCSDLLDHAEVTEAEYVWEDFVIECGRKGLLQRSRKVPVEASGVLAALLEGDLHGGVCTKLLSRRFVLEKGVRFNEFLSCYEDICFLAKVLTAGPKVSYLNASHYHYVQRPGSLVHSRAVVRMDGLPRALEELRILFEQWDDRVQGAFVSFWSRFCMEMVFDTGWTLHAVLQKMGGNEFFDFESLKCGVGRRFFLWLSLHGMPWLAYLVKRIKFAIDNVRMVG